jgi:hypothetical protein
MTNLAPTPSPSRTYPPTPASPNVFTNLPNPSPVEPRTDFHTQPLPKPATTYKTCTFIKTDGSVCQCPALTGQDFCYHHNRARLRQRNLQQARELKKSAGVPATLDDVNARILESLQVPCFDDAASIQNALSIVVQAVISNHISLRRAGLVLYALHTAASNLKAVRYEAAAGSGTALRDPQPIAALVAALGVDNLPRS